MSPHDPPASTQAPRVGHRGITISKSTEPRFNIVPDSAKHHSPTRQTLIARTEAYRDYRLMTASSSLPFLPHLSHTEMRNKTVSSISPHSSLLHLPPLLTPSSSTSSLTLYTDHQSLDDPKLRTASPLGSSNSHFDFSLDDNSSIQSSSSLSHLNYSTSSLPTYLSQQPKTSQVSKKWIRNPSIFARIRTKKKPLSSSSGSSLSSLRTMPHLTTTR